MPNGNTAWKTDNYKFVGKSFDYTYANRLNKLLAVVGEVDQNSIDYELEGAGGYGEMQPYTGNLNFGGQKRGFKTIITPGEFEKSDVVGYKQAKIDKMGECRKVGSRLGHAAAMTVYVYLLRMFAGAFATGTKAKCGGDGRPWADGAHPVASLRSEGRVFVPDPDAGTFSNKFTKALSVSAITDLQAAATGFVTPDGLPFLCDLNMLLVSPDLEATAAKICGSNGKWRPRQNPDGTATNEANPLPDLQYMVLGGGKDGFKGGQWALCDAALMRELVKIVYITRPKVFRSALDNPLQDCYTGYCDFGVGWGDARQILFSTGA